MKATLLKQVFRCHRALLWLAAVAMLLFILSAFAHLLLTWTGPQTAITRPPAQLFTATDMQAIPRILQRHGIREALQVRLVPSAQNALLQVTEYPSAPRRYFDVQGGDEIAGQDEQQARWLASYYLNDASRHIEVVEFQTAFDNDYPWVNRLLPVYKIRYAGDDGLTLYIHTETQALASISNHWKHDLQFVFRQLHTFEWLASFRHGRVVLMALLLASVLAMIGSGLCLLYVLKRRSQPPAARRAHRVIAHVVAIPLLGFTASGLYHLLHNEYAQTQRDFNLALPLLLDSFPAVPPALPAQSLHSVSLIAAGGQLFYRASLAEPAPASSGEHDHHNSGHALRQQRFDGIPKEQGSVYIPVKASVDVAMTDEQVARQLAKDHLGIGDGDVASVEKVVRFGPDYDFRNKRLPVWRVEINNAARDLLFVDVASGLLVDRVNLSVRAEAYSFSFLHKWNFLTHPLGRERRDALIAGILLLVLGLAGLGIRIKVSRS